MVESKNITLNKQKTLFRVPTPMAMPPTVLLWLLLANLKDLLTPTKATAAGYKGLSEYIFVKCWAAHFLFSNIHNFTKMERQKTSFWVDYLIVVISHKVSPPRFPNFATIGSYINGNPPNP